MYVNNEIGIIQPVKEIAKLIRWYRKHAEKSLMKEVNGNTPVAYPLFHTDAIQSVNFLDINTERLGVDLMSLSGSKIYGPKASGAVFVRNRAAVTSMFHGGDQEMGLRAGTEDTAVIAGFAKALEIARAEAEQEVVRLEKLRDLLMKHITDVLPDIVVNGGTKNRIVNNLSVSVPGISGERLVIELDAQGICVASKSACKEDDGEASHVIAALRAAAMRESESQ